MAEGKIARKKEDDEEEEEEEDPDKSPMLELQVWDRDKLDDDFMGRVGIVDIFPLHVVWTKHCSLAIAVKRKERRPPIHLKSPKRDPSVRPSFSAFISDSNGLIGLPPLFPLFPFA